MDLHFPQLAVALVVRSTPPPNATLVTKLGVQSVYLVKATEPPDNAKVAQGTLGGWNYPNGVLVSIVYAESIARMERFCEEENGEWLVSPRQYGNKFVGLLLTRSPLPFSIGSTPAVLK